MKKKTISLLLTFALFLTFANVPVFADEEENVPVFASEEDDAPENVIYNTNTSPDSAIELSLGNPYSQITDYDSELWYKVDPRGMYNTYTHMEVSLSGTSGTIYAYHSYEKAYQNIEYARGSGSVKMPIAWDSSYYYFKVTGVGSGTLGVIPDGKTQEPSIPEKDPDPTCTAEALAASEPSIFDVLNGMRSVRDNIFSQSSLGNELSDYYYTASKPVVSEILRDSDYRNALASDIKSLLPLVEGMINISEANSSDYVITSADIENILSIKSSVYAVIGEKEKAIGDAIWERLEVEKYVGTSLDTFVSERVTMAAKTISVNDAYSEYIVTTNQDIYPLVEKVNSILSEKNIDVRVSVRETENLFSSDKKYILGLLGTNNEDLIADILEKSGLFDEVSINFQIEMTSNDINYSKEWYLKNTGQGIPSRKNNDQLVKGTAGADVDYEGMTEFLQGKSRRSVLVAVIDTGLNYELADFSGRVDLTNAKNYTSSYSDDPMDDNDHGTHVTGILAANADNVYSIAGIDTNATILPIKVLDANGGGDANNLSKAIKHAVDSGANVINMSLNARRSNGAAVKPSENKECEEALKYAVDKGVTVVVAAGNSAMTDLSYPANSSYVITVGSTNNKNKRSEYSDRGSQLDVVAPGEMIASLTANGEVSFFSGTSMAAPIASGIVSVMYSLNPDMNLQKSLSIFSITSKDLGTKGYDKSYGYGLVNALKAAKLAENYVPVEKFTISKSKATIKKGKSTTLKVKFNQTMTPSNKKVTWSSSNKKIATVSANGVVKGVKKGKVTITAKSLDTGKKIKCVVTVK